MTIRDFMAWHENLGPDDLVRCFEALQAIDRIRFEFTVREEGYIERVEEIVDTF